MGNPLFPSTGSSRSDDSCQSTAEPVTDPTAWEGIKIFDISDVRNPCYAKAVETGCGSHTHTPVPGKGRNKDSVYVSSYLPGPSSVGPDCQYPFDQIPIIKVPLKRPAEAAVVAEPVLFPDGGNPGEGSTTYPTTGCHDITAHPGKDLAAGACMGDGALFGISAPEKPKVIGVVRDTENFTFRHSATFNNKVSTTRRTRWSSPTSSAAAPPATRPSGPTRAPTRSTTSSARERRSSWTCSMCRPSRTTTAGDTAPPVNRQGRAPATCGRGTVFQRTAGRLRSGAPSRLSALIKATRTTSAPASSWSKQAVTACQTSSLTPRSDSRVASSV